MHNLYIMKIRKKDFFIILTFTLLCSCVPQKKLIYIQPEDKKEIEKSFYVGSLTQNLIQPGDELYIRVSSFDETSSIFSNTGREYLSMTDVTLISYSVNEEGYVRLPYAGNVKLMNLTLDEASDYIEKSLKGYLNQPTVTIKFVNKKVTILGEVGNPGVYTFYDKRINILQAIGYASDITEFGNRKKVLVVREENNVVSKNYLDLTDEKIFASNYYIVRPNDIIYVEPLKRKKWGMNVFKFDLLFSTISTTLLILSFLNRVP
jgi:polysaccharide export outer membrane protein